MEIRLLRADKIECRIGTISDKGLSLLLYKDARADMKILDETFGILGWKRTHQSIDGNLYCTVEIWDSEKKEWISKQDVGTVSYTEKEKGQASDSFKRACVSVGIGRELYSASATFPTIRTGRSPVCLYLTVIQVRLCIPCSQSRSVKKAVISTSCILN